MSDGGSRQVSRATTRRSTVTRGEWSAASGRIWNRSIARVVSTCENTSTAGNADPSGRTTASSPSARSVTATSALSTVRGRPGSAVKSTRAT